MAKLAILVCALLFASAANSLILSSTFDTVKQKAEQAIDTAISQVKGKSEIAQKKAQELSEKLLEEATKFGKKIQTEIKNDLLKAEDDVNKLASKAKGIDVTECTEKVARLDQTALSVISNMSVCITDKLETGSGSVESIIKVSNDQLAKLTSLKEEVHHCNDNISGLKNFAAAIVCANAAAVKAAWISTQGVPEMVIQITELSFMSGTLKQSLVYCTATNGLVNFHQESSNIVEKAKRCIQEKIDKAPTITTPKIDYTTVHA